MAAEKPIGEVVHYFDKIQVAVIKLSSPLAVGDQIRIVGGQETDFNQDIESMQVDHKSIKKAKKGDEIGLKVAEKVREGYKVFKA
jgi:putative protease